MLPYGLFVGGLWHCLPIWDWLWNLLGLITASSYTLADVHKFQPCESSIRPVAKSNQIRPICIKLCWSCLMQNTARIIKFREHFYFERQKFTLESISEFINAFGMWSKVLSSKVVCISTYVFRHKWLQRFQVGHHLDYKINELNSFTIPLWPIDGRATLNIVFGVTISFCLAQYQL